MVFGERKVVFGERGRAGEYGWREGGSFVYAHACNMCIAQPEMGEKNWVLFKNKNKNLPTQVGSTTAEQEGTASSLHSIVPLTRQF